MVIACPCRHKVGTYEERSAVRGGGRGLLGSRRQVTLDVCVLYLVTLIDNAGHSIEEKLLDMGWPETSLLPPESSQYRKWKKLVYKPEELTVEGACPS